MTGEDDHDSLDFSGVGALSAPLLSNRVNCYRTVRQRGDNGSCGVMIFSAFQMSNICFTQETRDTRMLMLRKLYICKIERKRIKSSLKIEF